MEPVPNILEGFRNPDLAKTLIKAIENHNVDREVNLMEVCGTHTVSIARAGIKSIIPPNIHLISGPGCPVCVTANVDIDKVIALTKMPDTVITTFGDMTRVPGSTSSLLKEQARGADIRIVYSPLDALDVAVESPDKQVIFVGVGFETTTPLIASTVLRAKSMGLNNFSVFVAHKNMPGALETIVNDPQVKVDGLILPGHVSVIIGTKPYEFLAQKYHIPGVVTGFEPVDILRGVEMLMCQISDGESRIENAYARAVESKGNVAAKVAIANVFETCDAEWRGIGKIAGSGYRIRDEYKEFDAWSRFGLEVEPTVEPKGCRCGDVLRGVISPKECPLFRKVCTPENPVGPCMVSSEGSCAAYYRYY